MIIDCTINKWKFSERNQALVHIENAMTVDDEDINIVFDRSRLSSHKGSQRLIN